MILKDTNIRSALKSRQRGMLLNPYRFAAANDPNFANVTLLMHGEGADASTTLTDSSVSPNTMTPVGGTQIDTAQFKYGSASILFDGTGDYITSAINADYQFGTGDLTLETFIRFNVVGTAGIFSSYSDVDGGFILSYTGTALRLYARTTFHDRAWTPSTGIWYHLAISRAASVTRIFIDGIQLGADIADTRNWNPSPGNVNLQIGRTHTITNDFNGWMDEIRFTKGVGRYAANFTPPAASFPDF